MSESKEEILANFQSISGIEDVGEAFSHLEAASWDLMSAIQHVIPQEKVAKEDSSRTNNFSTLPSNCIKYASSTCESAPAVPSTSSAAVMDLTSDPNLDSTKFKGEILTFNIHFNQQIITIRLPSVATIGILKERILNKTKVPICRQSIRGWAPSKHQDAQKPSSKLLNLELSAENELILIDVSEEGYMDIESDDVHSRLEETFALNITSYPGGLKTTLNVSGKETILDVKTNVYYITDIPVRYQQWSGWPVGSMNETTLAQSGIEKFHNLTVRSLVDDAASSTKSKKKNSSLTIDSDSSIDEFEDASDFNACEEFFTDSTPTNPVSRNLIADLTDDELLGSMQFTENYITRFGEPNPFFFQGTLENALNEACHKPAKNRKLLAIYLHHGESILTNVFCDHLMKNDSVMQTLMQNFILFGWDLTFESNKNLFLSSVSACVGNTASVTVRNIPLDKLPAILIIGKSRLSGRSSCEVLSVIHGNVGLDDFLSRLIETVEMYTEHIQVEIREEAERAARDQVKAEQDMAYQETLKADMAKEAVKLQKEAEIVAERQKMEFENAEKNAKKEALRFKAQKLLPSEPEEVGTEITKIRVRKPTGEFLERRFFIQNTLKDLLNFVTANGFMIDDYKVISSWPRKDLTSVDTAQTLYNLKLFPQETVILEER